MDTKAVVAKKRTGIAFSIDPELRRKFQVKLLEKDMRMAPVLRKWIDNFVARGAP